MRVRQVTRIPSTKSGQKKVAHARALPGIAGQRLENTGAENDPTIFRAELNRVSNATLSHFAGLLFHVLHFLAGLSHGPVSTVDLHLRLDLSTPFLFLNLFYLVILSLA